MAGTRSCHIISPTLATAADSHECLSSVRVMEEFMQTQGQVQVLLNILECGMNPQQALAAAWLCLNSSERGCVSPKLSCSYHTLLVLPQEASELQEQSCEREIVEFPMGDGKAPVLIPAAVFIGLHNDNCCGCFGHEDCGKSCVMLSSVLAAFVGILGSGYCIIISALGLSHGPYCFTHLERNWIYPFTESSGGYLFEYKKWADCLEPQNIVQWNVTLFSILLVLGGIEFILCFIQIINAILGGLCGLCCSHEETYVC
ncbi:transmembrane 4 L6 family member 1-like isoform X2 [Falco naumanni]|uniref:transmembrane 4 L6 family member 1-like isoform X2 n=1 Tax=Falco naumanni TaxID=148594 RepID=UPI001ADE4F9A|nr:transmembrane 4 L6 family member 1-like isoform X2 [Falco naumanni]